MNNLKTLILLAVLSAILIGIGAIWGLSGIIVGFIIALVMNVGAYWFSDRVALTMAGAHEVSPADAPDLHRIVEEVASMAHLPKPRVYLVNNDQPNAFATGRNPQHAVVAVTTGIMRILDERELQAVIGHELGHIRNRDILISAVAAVIASTISFVAWMAQWALMFGGFRRSRNGGGGMIYIISLLAMIILAPIAATIIRLAISRAREYGADETGAHITHTPLTLASALEKLEAQAKVRPMNVNPALAHMYIVNPLQGLRQREGEGSGWFVSLFSTHPPIAKRIERLNEIARETGMFS